MDFAERELKKYGWKKGQGLGKANTGITEAIKPAFKNDLNGLGYDEHDDKSFKWWEYSFNKAASNLEIKQNEKKIIVKTASVTEISINRPKKKRKADLVHGNFYKEGVSDIEEPEINCDKFVTKVSDEELFKICGGRTIHKGARNGLQLKGKLFRLAQQESSLATTEITMNACDITPKAKKKRKKTII